jgi:hypothetical protein
MSAACQHCGGPCDSCTRCDAELDVGDLDGHEDRHGLAELLSAHGGQSHE